MKCKYDIIFRSMISIIKILKKIKNLESKRLDNIDMKLLHDIVTKKIFTLLIDI